jgi:hypothetical protein
MLLSYNKENCSYDWKIFIPIFQKHLTELNNHLNMWPSKQGDATKQPITQKQA